MNAGTRSDTYQSIYPVTSDNKQTKVSERDVEDLERYEKLLYVQNRRNFLKLEVGGSTMLRPKERLELQELVKLRRNK